MKGSQRLSNVHPGRTSVIVPPRDPATTGNLPLSATGFKRLGLALLAGFGLSGVILAGSTILTSSENVRQQALNEIRGVTGLDPILRGDSSVSLFPSGTVSFGDVVLGDPARPALTAERLVAHLRFFPLLIGRVEIADVSLERPKISIDLSTDGDSNWTGLILALARSQRPGLHRSNAFSEMRIDNGTVVLHDVARDVREQLQDVNVSLAWPSISKTFGATGRFVWHGQPMDASLTLADFAAALGGNQTGLKIRMAGAPLKAAFEGSVSIRPTIKVDGTFAADGPSLRDVLVWSGGKPLPGGGFGHFSIKAQTNVSGGSIALSGVNVELDGNTAEGVLSFATDGRKTLQGTLASNTLDFSPYVSTVRLLTANQREWNAARIGLDGLTGLDLDLRVSAAKVLLSNATFGRTAIGANLRGGKLTVTVGEAQAYGGVIKGSVTLTDQGEGVDLQSQLNFADVDLETCLGQLFGVRRLTGRGSMTLTAEGMGESVLAVTRTLNGDATLTGRNGALAGLNVEQLLKRLERRPLSGGGEFRSGRTPFDKIIMNLKITNGIVAVEDMTLDGTAVKLAVNGSASIPLRELDLKGTAALATASQPGTEPFSLPFIVQGSWDDPIMLPDPEALIRRSGAAAPLLDAIREQGARDRVKAAIQRLTGAPTADALPQKP
jgi:AsmA protein